MGIKERKEREKDKMRHQILTAANKLFIDKGIEETSIRNIAGMIEFSPATIYLYFKDKNEILYHLQAKAYDNFEKKINEFAFMKDNFSRLKKLSLSYIEFASKNPSQFDLLFYPNSTQVKSAQSDPSPREKIHTMIREAVSATLSNNQLTRMPVNDAVSMVWSFIHGLAILSMRNHLSYLSSSEYGDHINSLINRFFNGLKGNY